jgi:hypothetical protein
MTIFEITPEVWAKVAMWVIGGFCALAMTLLVYIGNAGSAIKKSVNHLEVLQAKHMGATENFVQNQLIVNQQTGQKLDHLERKVDDCYTTIIKQKTA